MNSDLLSLAAGSKPLLSGTLALRPPAGSVEVETLYLATDTGGGTLYRAVRTNTGVAWVQAAVGVTGGTWGNISGTLANQTDLQTALDAKQPLDSMLTLLASVTVDAECLFIGNGSDSIQTVVFSSNSFPARASTGTLSAKVISNFGLSLVDDGNAETARDTLGLAIGTNVQAYDADLAAIAGLTSAADKGIMFTGAGTAEVYALTPAALTVLDDATVAAMVDTLGGAAATGTGGIARATSPTFVTPLLGTPTSGVLTNCTGLPTAGLVDDAVTNGKLRDSAAVSVIGRSANSAGDPADIGAASHGQTLSHLSNVVAFRGGFTLLATATPSASATVDFTLTGWTNGDFAAYLVVFSHVAAATDNVELLLRTSTDGGSTFDAGASDYSWARWGVTEAATSGAGGDTADTEIGLDNGIGNAANETVNGHVLILDPSAAKYFHATWQVQITTTAGALEFVVGCGRRLAAADVDAVRFLMSSGNIASGEFRLYGIGNA
jgi:hypothetical protein